MPAKSKKPCLHPGCSRLTTRSYCDEHQRSSRPKDTRPSAAKRGYDNRWRKYRESFLRKNPICVDCMKKGIAIPAIVVDHIIPHKGDQKLFWDKENHQALCKRCHDRKTAREDGGFGNTRALGEGGL